MHSASDSFMLSLRDRASVCPGGVGKFFGFEKFRERTKAAAPARFLG